MKKLSELTETELAALEVWPSTQGAIIRVSKVCLEHTLGPRPRLILHGDKFAVANHQWSVKATELATEILQNIAHAHPSLRGQLEVDHWGNPKLVVHEEKEVVNRSGSSVG